MALHTSRVGTAEFGDEQSPPSIIRTCLAEKNCRSRRHEARKSLVRSTWGLATLCEHHLIDTAVSDSAKKFFMMRLHRAGRLLSAVNAIPRPASHMVSVTSTDVCMNLPHSGAITSFTSGRL